MTFAARVARVVGFLLLVPAGMLYAVSGLVVPMPWLVGFWLIFVGLVVYAITHRDEPWHVLATPLVALVVWVALVTAGGAFLDWTA